MATPITSAGLTPEQFAGVQAAQATVNQSGITPTTQTQGVDNINMANSSNGTPAVPLPSIPTSISSSSITPATTNVNFQAPTIPSPYNTSNLSSLASSVPQQAPLSSAEQSYQDLINQTMDLNTQEAGRGAYEAGLQKQAGFSLDANGNPTNQAMLDLTTQLNSLTTQAAQIPLQLQNDSTGRGITASGLAPIQADALRTNAIKALGVSSLIAAQQGKLAYSNSLVNQAVNEKYAPIEAQIKANTANQQLILNSPNYTNAEKARAQANLDAATAKTAAIAQQKQDTATITAWASAALANGATSLQAQQILAIAQSPNPDLKTAFNLYAPFAKDPNKTAQDIADLNYKRAQTNELNSKANTQALQTQADNTDIPSVVSSISNPNATSSKLFGLTVNGLTEKAQVYMTNGGNIQGLGLGNTGNVSGQRTLIANYGAYLASKMGLTIPEITASYKANSKAASAIISRTARIETTSSTLTAQFPRLMQLADQVSNLGIQESDLTAGKAAFSRKFGSVPAANYFDLINTIRQDYSSMQASVAGSQGAQYFSQSADQAIPTGLTSAQYQGIGQTILQSAALAQQAGGNEATKLITNSTSPNANSNTPETVTKGTEITLGGKIYSYNGTGDTADIKNYTPK